jgi:hypothetical protein
VLLGVKKKYGRKMRTKKDSSDRNYIDNDLFLQELIDYKNRLKNNPQERIPEYIGKCILLICNKLGSRGNFSSYTYLSEMVEDAIEDCLKAVNNFDPTFVGVKGNVNPFGYFGKIAWWAFLQRISAEKEEQYVKHKNFQNIHLLSPDDGNIIDSIYSDQIIGDFEEMLKKKKNKKENKENV